jgi:hypothetical protein
MRFLSKSSALVASCAIALPFASAQNSSKSGYDYVDPLIGTINGGGGNSM